MTKWEYLRIQEPTNQQLTNIGADGWELVSVVSSITSFKQRWNNGMFSNIYVFKRELPVAQMAQGRGQAPGGEG